MKEYSKSVVLCSLFKLLLIEDDESLFQEIKDILTQWSYEVYGVTDFGNVIQEFTAIKPDLVIIDIQLPKFDGFHWCRMIRSHSNVPILFLSSRDHPTDMVMSMQLGGDDFIQKPFHFEVLLQKFKPSCAVFIITAQNKHHSKHGVKQLLITKKIPLQIMSAR